MTDKTRKKYSAQFKEQAIERAQKEGVRKAAEDLGIHETLLYSWRKKLEQTGVSFEDQKLQAAEMVRLRRENARLEQECAFLKKAAAYFAKEEKGSTR